MEAPFITIMANENKRMAQLDKTKEAPNPVSCLTVQLLPGSHPCCSFNNWPPERDCPTTPNMEVLLMNGKTIGPSCLTLSIVIRSGSPESNVEVGWAESFTPPAA